MPDGPMPDIDPYLSVVRHPVVADRLCRLREASTDSAAFRRLVSELSALLCYEALDDLGTELRRIDTPVADGVECSVVAENVLVVPILRAGLGMVPAIQETLPLTDVAHVGLRRDDATLESVVYLNALPADLSGRRVVVCDPMLATGGSLAKVCTMVADRNPAEIIVLCLIASEEGMANFRQAHPRVRVTCAGLDPLLNEQGYIVPGLGDAGDRLFGPPPAHPAAL